MVGRDLGDAACGPASDWQGPEEGLVPVQPPLAAGPGVAGPEPDPPTSGTDGPTAADGGDAAGTASADTVPVAGRPATAGDLEDLVAEANASLYGTPPPPVVPCEAVAADVVAAVTGHPVASVEYLDGVGAFTCAYESSSVPPTGPAWSIFHDTTVAELLEPSGLGLDEPADSETPIGGGRVLIERPGRWVVGPLDGSVLHVTTDDGDVSIELWTTVSGLVDG